jgi:exonuclease III
MNKKLFFLVFFTFSLYAVDFKVASYNVENLFDVKYDKTEYKEYIPNTRYWNQKAYKNKLLNISKVINEIDADILALQEIESSLALDDLKQFTNYKYSKFIKKKTTAVGVAILSKYPILKNEYIEINRFDKHSRYILKSTLDINGKQMIIYVNHWRSKRAPESKRIYYAYALKNDIKNLKKDNDYLILGDLNSNYNEFETFKYDKKLNDTDGITAINQVLNTSYNGNMLTKSKLFNGSSNLRYNLWLELNKKDRFSSIFRKQKNTPDNMIISKSLIDNKNISYINNSFGVFKPNYLFTKNYLKRWNHKKAKGFSDHLPIYASFSTEKQQYSFEKVNKIINSISSLYTIETLNEPVTLKNCVVIYKNKNIAIITKENDRAIMIYKPASNLKQGFSYDLIIDSIDTYNGLKEIKGISSIKNKKEYKNFDKFYLSGDKIDLFNLNFQNSIVKGLNGIYKKGYLYYAKDKKIKLYFKKGFKKPNNGDNITIKQGHLGIYKSKVQIVIYSKEDIKS